MEDEIEEYGALEALISLRKAYQQINKKLEELKTCINLEEKDNQDYYYYFYIASDNSICLNQIYKPDKLEIETNCQHGYINNLISDDGIKNWNRKNKFEITDKENFKRIMKEIKKNRL